jgi:hypothetical protein
VDHSSCNGTNPNVSRRTYTYLQNVTSRWVHVRPQQSVGYEVYSKIRRRVLKSVCLDRSRAPSEIQSPIDRRLHDVEETRLLNTSGPAAMLRHIPLGFPTEHAGSTMAIQFSREACLGTVLTRLVLALPVGVWMYGRAASGWVLSLQSIWRRRVAN